MSAILKLREVSDQNTENQELLVLDGLGCEKRRPKKIINPLLANSTT